MRRSDALLAFEPGRRIMQMAPLNREVIPSLRHSAWLQIRLGHRVLNGPSVGLGARITAAPESCSKTAESAAPVEARTPLAGHESAAPLHQRPHDAVDEATRRHEKQR